MSHVSLLHQDVIDKVQQTRVRESVKRVDPCAVAVRRLFMQHYRIQRRRYNVRAPMSLWHVDTNHKLIRYLFTDIVSEALIKLFHDLSYIVTSLFKVCYVCATKPNSQYVHRIIVFSAKSCYVTMYARVWQLKMRYFV